MSEILLLKRSLQAPEATVGQLYLPDGTMLCDTLEDTVRNVKIPKKTAIPAGTYELGILWSRRYNRLMPRLVSVPFFTDILVHPGNDAGDTEGCILVGKYNKNMPNWISGSRDTFDRIFPIIRKLTEHGKTYLTVEGGFEPNLWVKGAHDGI